jgi:hypothetical protein
LTFAALPAPELSHLLPTVPHQTLVLADSHLFACNGKNLELLELEKLRKSFAEAFDKSQTEEEKRKNKRRAKQLPFSPLPSTIQVRFGRGR